MTDPVRHGPARPETESQGSGDVAEWVVFACGGRRFGLAIRRVREVVTPRPLTRLPGSDAAVRGLMGLRGRIVTVVDVGAALGVGPVADGADARILLVDRGESVVGLAVEAVVGVARAGLEPGRPDRSDGRGQDGDAVIGVGLHEDETFLMLDPDRILERLLRS